MAMKKVDKTGVYRSKDGHAVYLTEGSMADERMLKDYSLDAEASTDFGKESERSYFGGVQDAPANQKAEDTWSSRSAGPAPENRMEPAPSENRSDTDLAAGANKTAKKS
jgi:hypothetical protein